MKGTLAQKAPQESSLSSPAAQTIRTFYDAINRRDFDAAALLIADDCVYEDMVYEEPFVGKQKVNSFFKKICSNMPDDLEFIIDRQGRSA